MRIPDELIIFGRIYQVQNVSPVQTLEGVLGAASYRDGTIYLDDEVDMALALSVLWHEAVHVAQQELTGTIDEVQARWIALFVHTFLLNNPDILDCYRFGIDDSPFDEEEEA